MSKNSQWRKCEQDLGVWLMSRKKNWDHSMSKPLIKITFWFWINDLVEHLSEVPFFHLVLTTWTTGQDKIPLFPPGRKKYFATIYIISYHIAPPPPPLHPPPFSTYLPLLFSIPLFHVWLCLFSFVSHISHLHCSRHPVFPLLLMIEGLLIVVYPL